MKNILKIIATLSLLSICLLLVAQPGNMINGNINLKYNNYGTSVTLRWVPDNFALWQYLNKYGYSVQRISLIQGKNPERTLMNSSPIKPLSKDEFEALALGDENVAVAGGILYGDTVNYTFTTFKEAVQLDKENNERISFALLCADNSSLAAKALGLSYTDKSISKSGKYIYLVYPAVVSDSIKIDTARIFVNVSEITVWPKPEMPKAIFGDRLVTLGWSKEFLKKYYTSYFIERSDDGGKTYLPLNKTPLISMSDPNNKILPQDIVMFRDSLPKNDFTYFFRIRGKNSFAEYGPWSNTVSGKGSKNIVIPELLNPEVVNNQNIMLHWSFPDSLNYLIKGFAVNIAYHSEGPFKPAFEKLLKPNERNAIYISKFSSNYFTVAAIRVSDGRGFESFPVFVPLIDTVPPSAPTGLQGKVDSAGHVNITWLKNTEDDLLGYRVYISNSLNDEYSQVTDSAIVTNNFSFKISLNNLSNKLYCMVGAEDYHFNGSQFSKVLELIKPDTIKPTCPVFKKVYPSDTSIYLTWYASSSDDVAFHTLYRRAKDSAQFVAINKTNLNAKVISFSDQTSEPGKLYEYYLTATDLSNNQSPPSPSFNAIRLKSDDAEKLKLTAEADRKTKVIILSWKIPKKKVERFFLYKAVEASQLSTYCTLPGNTTLYSDKQLEINTSYKYKVVAEYTDGTKKFSEIIKISY